MRRIWGRARSAWPRAVGLSLWLALGAVARAQPRMGTTPPGGLGERAKPASTRPPANDADATDTSPLRAESTTASQGVPLSLVEVLQTTLARHPSLAAARATLALRGAELELARAPFDVIAAASLGHDHQDQPVLPIDRVFGVDPAAGNTSDTTTLTLGARTRFAIGTRLEPSLSLSRIDDRFGVAQRARADLTLTQPLLRGAGTDGAASAVAAGRHGQAAARHALRDVAQSQAFEAAVAYWTLVAAHHEQTLYETSVARSQTLLDETAELVEADQRPRGDLRQLQGNLQNRKRALWQAQNDRLQAQHALRLAMGLDLDAAADWRPSDDFPKGHVPAGDATRMAHGAVTARPDMRAARAAVAQSQASYDGADHNTLPALDLSVSVGYAGASPNDGLAPFFESAGSRVPGVSGGALLSLELPVGNIQQGAERGQAYAVRQAAVIERDNLGRTIRTQVLAAHDALRLSARALSAAEQAEENFRQALQDERDKLRAGLSTVIDVVLTEQLLTEAQLSRIQSQLDYAVALCRLRRQTGSLPAHASEVGRARPWLTDATLDAGVGATEEAGENDDLSAQEAD